MLGWPPTWSRLLLLPAIFLGFTIHELAHALVAFALGDTSQVERKRLSFNPLRHVSMIGLIAFLVIGLGWAKPVSVDDSRFRIKNRHLGMFLVSIAGVSANLLAALLVLLGMWATIYLVLISTGASVSSVTQYLFSQSVQFDWHGLVVALSFYMISVNVALGLFNLIPIPPLDGFLVLMSLFAMISGALRAKPRGAAASVPAPALPEGDQPLRSPAQIHFDIGLQYQKEGQMDEAIARYRQAIGQGGEFPLAYYNMGLTYWAKGRLDLAKSAFKSASLARSDPQVRAQALARLRELAQDGQAPGAAPPAPPPAFESGDLAGAAPPVATPIDPTVKRRLWLRLSLGGLGMLILAFGAWLFVTGMTYLAVLPK